MRPVDEIILADGQRSVRRTRTLGREATVEVDGFHWEGRAGPATRAYRTCGWEAAATVDGRQLVRGRVVDVDVVGSEAVLAVRPPRHLTVTADERPDREPP